jgi:Fe-S-cluster containining protein
MTEIDSILERAAIQGIQMCAGTEKKKEPIECNRCGQCCQMFTLPWSWGRIKANQQATLRGESEYSYADDAGIMRRDHINPMMAVWASELYPQEPPEEMSASRKEYDLGRHWYSCGHLKLEKEGGWAFCKIHDHRPSVCSGFLPHWMGGYIHDGDQIIYPGCSFRVNWPEKDPPAMLAQVAKIKPIAVSE